MRKILYCMVFVLVISAGIAHAALTADTNLALEKTAVGTFTKAEAALDGIVSTSVGAPAASGKLTESPQILTIDLRGWMYVERVKVFWDNAAYSNNYEIRVSSNAKTWFPEMTGINAEYGVFDRRTGARSQSISCKRFTQGSRYVQIYIPFGSKATNPAGDFVRIAEVQVYPAVGQKFELEDVSAYVVTPDKAILTVKTNLGAARASVLYGTSPDALSHSAAIHETGQLTSATLYNLIPYRTYFYKVRVWDLYGNMAESRVKNFAPAKNNIALGKRVLGTFTELPPRDPYVDRTRDVLSRVTDGGTSYFTAMATSKSVLGSDQYATIDLGKEISISNVITYWRNLAYPQDFSVLVSFDKKKWFDGLSKLNAALGAFTRSDTGDPVRVVNADLAGVKARYVMILIKKGSSCFQKHANWDFVQLMEAQVIPE